MLKTIASTGSATNTKETEGKISSNSVISNSIVDSGEATNQTNSIKRKNQMKMIKSKIMVKFKNQDFFSNSRNKEAGTGFFTSETRLAFI